jgi:hypothetical protein
MSKSALSGYVRRIVRRVQANMRKRERLSPETLEAETFILAWEPARSAESAARSLRWPVGWVDEFKQYLQEAGVPVKEMPSPSRS